MLDMSAGLVFAMILVFQLVAGALKEPSVPLPDTVTFTLIFEEEPLSREAMSNFRSIGSNTTEWAGFISDEQQVSSAFLDTVFDLPPNYPSSSDAAKFVCGLDNPPGNPNNYPSYRNDGKGEEALKKRQIIQEIGDESQVVEHLLVRPISLNNPFRASSGAPKGLTELLDREVASLGISLDLSMIQLPIAHKDLIEDDRNYLDIRNTSNEVQRVPPKREATVGYRSLGYQAEKLSASIYATDEAMEMFSSLDMYSALDSSADDIFMQSLSALLPIHPFGKLTCVATGIGVAQSQNFTLRIDGNTGFREIRPIAIQIDSRGFDAPRSWSPYASDTFPGRIYKLDGESVEFTGVLRISEPIVMELEL